MEDINIERMRERELKDGSFGDVVSGQGYNFCNQLEAVRRKHNHASSPGP